MLQTKQISKVLSQGLNPISKELSTNGVNEPLSLSLLSHSGLPLTTVSNHSVEQESLTVDNLKIYSLLAMSHFKEPNNTEEDEAENGNNTRKDESNWAGMAIDKDLHLIIQKVNYAENVTNGDNSEGGEQNVVPENGEDSLYVVIFYKSEFPHAIAKLKIDNVCNALAEGLKGYN